MDTATAEPFADVTLEYFAEIIADHFTGTAITTFFQRAGFPQYAHDGSTKKWFIYKALQEIQGGEDGSSKIKKIIEHFCNPKERVSEEYVDSVRNILSDYDLTITTSGKIVAKAKLPDAVDIIERIARRFHLVVDQLKKRHNGRETLLISNEYDVQDLFHAMLHLYFEDIRPEEPTPSYSGKPSRMDFLLKPEQIVVEIKKTRDKLRNNEVCDQLSIDIIRYRTHPDCKTLIAFVYDPDRYISNPRGMEADLSQAINNLNVKVIVSPY